jgi:hypothetical protein
LCVATTAESRGKYIFEGRTVRLIERDFTQWCQSFHAIGDLRGELQALDDWLQGENVPEAKRRNWFQVVSRILRRKHDETMAKSREADTARASFEARFPPQCLPDSQWRALLGDEEFERRRDTLQIREAPR